MKKILFATVAMAAALVMGDAIESQNVVGYTTQDIPAGKWMMIGAQLEKIGGGAMNFEEAFKLNVTGPAAWISEEDEECIPGWYANAPAIKITLGTVDKGYLDLYWCSKAWDDDLGFVAGWADADGVYFRPEDLAMVKGYGVWMIAGEEDVSVTVSGEVLAADSDVITAGTGWNMMKLPYPVELNAMDTKIAWNLHEIAPLAWASEEAEECIEGWTLNAPAIKVPLGTVDKGYYDLFYTQNAWDDDLGFVEGWADADGVYVADASLKVGMAFWYIVPEAVTTTVSK